MWYVGLHHELSHLWSGYFGLLLQATIRMLLITVSDDIALDALW